MSRTVTVELNDSKYSFLRQEEVWVSRANQIITEYDLISNLNDVAISDGLLEEDIQTSSIAIQRAIESKEKQMNAIEEGDDVTDDETNCDNRVTKTKNKKKSTSTRFKTSLKLF